MVSAFLIPIPFAIVFLVSLLSRNPKNRWLGYLGSIAGLATLWLALTTPHGSYSFEWFKVGGIAFPFALYVDSISVLLASIVGGVGTFVFLYSVGYFEPGEDLRRYYAVLSLFAMAMLGAVLAQHLFTLIFFWELVGVSSFLLIGFWNGRASAIAAARKAFLTIIVGDAFLLGGTLALWLRYGTLDIQMILSAAQADTLTLIGGIGIMVGAMSKSAQFPLHDWLADAMEGPTPVSAFLHSATMVKAGLYLIARMLPLLLLAGLGPWLAAVAVLTIIVSATMALVENDIKRVLAYSTMNQLAFILLALSVGALSAGMVHLLTHSAFKALLFFSAGIAIHAAGTQDLRKMRIKFGWDTFSIATLIGILALAGVIPFSGFFSKEAIFEGIISSGHIELIVLFALAIVLSAAYITRWGLMLFGKEGAPIHTHWTMRFPLPILALISALGGLVVAGLLEIFGAEAHGLSWSSGASVVLVLFGAWCAYLVVRNQKGATAANSAMADAFRAQYRFPWLEDRLGRLTMRKAAAFEWLDSHVLDGVAIGVGSSAVATGARLRHGWTGKVRSYVVALLLGFILLMLAVGVLG